MHGRTAVADPEPAMRRFVLLPVLTVVASLATTLALSTSAYAVIPKAPVVLPAGIEVLAPYQPQTFCDPVDKAGVRAFGSLLTKTYPDTSIVDISRPCVAGDISEHYDGRALDWGASYQNATQVKEVQTVFAWLFATDPQGNKLANLRRLGIMYIIWNKQIWGVWSQRWEPYPCSGVTACHQDHVHFSFDWSGAEKLTSFWTGKVANADWAPRYVYTSPAFAQTVSVSATRLSMSTAFALQSGLRYLFTVSGRYHYGSASTQLADAECSLGPTGWSTLAPGAASTATGTLHLFASYFHYWRASVDTGGGCNTLTHTYTRVLTFTTTAPVLLALHDGTAAGRSGSVTVTVRRLL
jgi:hypothetical protein